MSNPKNFMLSSKIWKGARSWQRDMSKQLSEIYKYSRHAYAQAPTGVGKTYLMALYGELYISGPCLIIVGRYDLVKQHTQSLKKLHNDGKIKDITKWYVMTWQQVASIARKGKSHILFSTLINLGMIFFDECHIGGSSKNPRSLARIKRVFNPDKWMNISATTWDVNENVLGKRDGYISTLSYERAYNDGYLHSVLLNRVDCGMTMSLRARELEDVTGIPFCELTEETPESLYTMLKKLGKNINYKITVKDIESIVKYRIKVLLGIYMKKYFNEKSIFWVPNTHYVEYAVNEFNKMVEEKNGEENWGKAIYSKNSHVTNDSIKKEFIENETTRVVFACNMLIEGFDYPELYLMFDAAYNVKNIRRVIQKIGRGSRKHPGKPISEYYYAVDVRHMLVGDRRLRKGDDDLQTPESLKELDMEAVIDRFYLIQEARSQSNDINIDDDIPMAKATVKKVKISTKDDNTENKEVEIASVPFFDIDNISGVNQRKKVSFQDLFNSVNTRKKLLNMAVEGFAIEDLSKDLMYAFFDITLDDRLFYYKLVDHNPTWKLEYENSLFYDGVDSVVDYVNSYMKTNLIYPYDAKFEEKIIHITDRKKEDLEKLAKDNTTYEEIPENLLGLLNPSYPGKSENSYDVTFDEKIKKLMPNWFK